MYEQNFILVDRSHQEGMVARDEAVIDEIYAEDFVNETPGLPDNLKYGRAAIHDEYRWLWSAFSDIRISHYESAAEDDFVGLRWIWEATHTGPFLGIPATGARIVIEGYDIIQVRDGQIWRAWVYQDNAGLMAQLQSAAAKQT